MADISIPGMFLVGDHASRPAANAVGGGSLYACSDHTKVYQSDGSSWSDWFDPTGLVGGGATPQSARGRRTTTTATTSTSFVDADGTNYSLTITTAATRVMVGFVGAMQVDAADVLVCFDVTVDGTREGGTNGLTANKLQSASDRNLIAFTHLTDVLTAASHTFKLQWKTASSQAHLVEDGTFWVVEVA